MGEERFSNRTGSPSDDWSFGPIEVGRRAENLFLFHHNERFLKSKAHRSINPSERVDDKAKWPRRSKNTSDLNNGFP